jgi:hypothetical protein
MAPFIEIRAFEAAANRDVETAEEELRKLLPGELKAFEGTLQILGVVVNRLEEEQEASKIAQQVYSRYTD